MSNEPPGWRTGPAWQEMNGRKQRGRRIRSALGMVLAAGLAVVAVNPSLVTSRLPGDAEGTGGSAATATEPLPAETAAPTASPAHELFPDTPTLQDPFRGSPAARYADGAKGIVLPEAKPIGSLSKEQVATALEATRAFIIDANLNPATLRGEHPKTAFARLDSEYDEFVPEIESWLNKPGKDADPTWLFTRFDPDEVDLVGKVVKTRGRMTFTAGEHGSVRIRADYTFVYPVMKVDGSTEVARTVVRRVLEFDSYNPNGLQVTAGKLWVTAYNVDIGNDDCRAPDGYLHPQFDSDLRASPPPAGPTVDPYDRSRDINAEDAQNPAGTCGTGARA
ncbi:hypothetical protein JL475_33695 [Streptomyces sp. M2CJ-2]|uniref:hypothetical protein n=1 Tax=Streptomyces sp. M2CJ-2 TaxID=2803948 RepID=UPI0019287929|nr:hypothetical protein [Streptomyces sp. M2CJ-2]MBL3670827.1 hypothetical protein [Streptomyces sp. M2CJ-2]